MPNSNAGSTQQHEQAATGGAAFVATQRTFRQENDPDSADTWAIFVAADHAYLRDDEGVVIFYSKEAAEEFAAGMEQPC